MGRKISGCGMLNIEKMIMETPAEEFNSHKRRCGHTDLMKKTIGTCVAQLRCGGGLAQTQFNGFPMCIGCKYYYERKAREIR